MLLLFDNSMFLIAGIILTLNSERFRVGSKDARSDEREL